MKYKVSILDKHKKPISTMPLCDDLSEIENIESYITVTHFDENGEAFEELEDNPFAVLPFPFSEKTTVYGWCISDKGENIYVSMFPKVVFEAGETMGLIKTVVGGVIRNKND